MHVATGPTRAEILVDERLAGKSPILLAISPRAHVLTLPFPNALDATEAIDVGTNPMDLTIPLWSRRPQVVPLRLNYPGASLLDARWLADGQVILTLGVGQPATRKIARNFGASIRRPDKWNASWRT